MADVTEYTWRSFSGLFRPSKIKFNFPDRLIEFENSIPPNGFFNLFHQKYVQCPFADVTGVDAYTRMGTRCLEVKTKYGSCVYLGDTVPRFDELVADFMRVISER